jgi:hypothetical protein
MFVCGLHHFIYGCATWSFSVRERIEYVRKQSPEDAVSREYKVIKTGENYITKELIIFNLDPLFL